MRYIHGAQDGSFNLESETAFSDNDVEADVEVAMTRWMGAALLGLLLAAAPAWADMNVGNVGGGNEELTVTATPGGSKWTFSTAGGGRPFVIILTPDDLRQAQSVYTSCMRMDASALPVGRPFNLGNVRGISFQVERATGGRRITVGTAPQGGGHSVVLDAAGQAQMQALLVSAVDDQRTIQMQQGARSNGSTQAADPNSIDNAKDIMHHWHP